MKELFTDLYKKVAGFFQTQEKEEAAAESKNIAVNRMKLVLMQDRTNLTPFLLEKMRGEMIEVLAKYVEMDKEALELNFEQEGEQMALMLSIPVIRAKDEDEIKAILNAEEKAKEESEIQNEEGEESEGSQDETETQEDSEAQEQIEGETLAEEIEESGCGEECECGGECSCNEDENCGCEENGECNCEKAEDNQEKTKKNKKKK